MELVCILAPAAQDARLAGVGSEGTGNCPTISERDRYWVSVSNGYNNYGDRELHRCCYYRECNLIMLEWTRDPEPLGVALR